MIDSGGEIVRTERRRRYSDAEKAAIVAESLCPDVTVTSVARRFIEGEPPKERLWQRAASRLIALETAKLNDINPQVWLTDVLDRIGKGHPINRVD